MEISEIYKGKSYHCQITSFKKKFKQLKKTQDTTPLNESLILVVFKISIRSPERF